MAEKRRSKRHSRRLKVRFGDAGSNAFPHNGLTNDVSSTGIFVVTGTNQKPGTRLHLEVMMTGEQPLFIEGVVARQVIVPPELRQVVRAGFGLRYLTGTELMAELVPALQGPKKDDPFTVVFDDESTWREAFEKEFRRGGCFVWSPKPQAPNSIVTLTIELRYSGRTLAFEARVVHVMPGPDGRHGVALMFVDAAGVAASLASTLGQ
ncbi:MAG: PilZ domain-containing protein [Myxococcaceae bacterium]